MDKMCWELYQCIQKNRLEDKELDVFGNLSRLLLLLCRYNDYYLPITIAIYYQSVHAFPTARTQELEVQ